MSPAPSPEITLVVLAPEHAAELAALEECNRDHLRIGAPEREPAWFTEAGQRAAIAALRTEREEGRALPMVIMREEPAGRRIVGRISVNGITRGAAQSASLGYWVDRDESGQGIATAAVKLAVAAAFGGLGLHRLQAEVQVGNDASAAVLQRCGFTEVGLAPQMLRLGGDWADCRLFQLVHPAWKEPSAAGAGHRSGLTLHVELPEREETLALYEAVGWSAYLEDPEALHRAIAGSARVVSARQDGELVGLARVISDGASIAYLQDVLVAPRMHRRGLGRRLVEAVLEPYADLRQQVLLTGDDPGQRAFYEALGMTEVHDHPAGLRAFVRLR